MAQSGSTPIQLYGSTTSGNTPSASNLTTSSAGVELAINAYDGKLFYKDTSGVVQVLASKVSASNSISFGTTGLTPSTATQGAVTVAGTLNVSNGGTGVTSVTSGSLIYGNGSSALNSLSIGTSGQYLSSSGTAPQWSSAAAMTSVNDTNVTLTLGGSPSTSLFNATSLTLGWTGQLSISRGGTNATATPTAGAVAYGTGTAYAFTSAGTSGQVLTSNGSGTPTWTTISPGAGGVVTFSAGSTGFSPSTATNGNVVLSGTLAIGSGGTNGTATPTAGAVAYGTGTAYAFTSAGTTGQVLTSNGASAPTWATPSTGVSSFNAGTTGFTPNSATTGAITLAGTLNVTNGGTGLTSLTAGSLMYGAGSGTFSTLAIGTSGQYLSSSGTAPAWSSAAALTATNDTNVTLTLGGSSSTALLNAASLTLGWTGQLAVSRGGTNSTSTPTAGAVAYGTGTAYAFTSAGTSGQVLTSNGSSAPTWTTPSSSGVSSFSAGSTGLTPNSATTGAITLGGTLGTGYGGTGLTSFNSGGLVYASSSSALATSSTFKYDGTNLAIGTSSPVSVSNYTLLTLNNSTGSGIYMLSNGNAIAQIYVNSSSMNFGTYSSYPLLFNINSSEQMRIDTSGNLLVNQTSITPSNTGVVIGGGAIVANGYKSHNGITGSTWQNLFNLYYTGSSTQLWIDSTNTGTITVSSDYRIKQNVQTQSSTALDRVAQIRPVTYEYQDYPQLNWKADGVSREGFIAHELAAIIPSAVEGDKDAPNQIQSLRLDALCSVLVKAIQELASKVSTLESQLATKS
jgi:Chaperone of endosialidase